MKTEDISEVDVESIDVKFRLKTTFPRLSMATLCFFLAMWHGIQKDGHVRGLATTLLWFGSLCWVLISRYHAKQSDYLASIVFCAIFYVIYLVESFLARTANFVFSKRYYVHATKYVEELRLARPTLSEQVTCFHYVTRTRKVLTTVYVNNQPTTQMKTEIFRRRIIKHVAKKEYEYSTFEDVTLPVPNLDKYQLCKICCTKRYDFANAETKSKFLNTQAMFHQEHSDCDSQRIFSTVHELSGFKHFVMAVADDNAVPLGIQYSEVMYVLLTLLGASWCYRVWLTGVCREESIAFTKKLAV